MGEGMLSLSWNNHSTTFCHTLTHLRQKNRYSDATISCDGQFYPVHQLVLSTCSQYFEDMFEYLPGKHPVVVLQDVRRWELEALLSYMYAGVVSVAQKDLARLIKLAELLQIKGLAVPDQLPGEKNDKSSSQRVAGGSEENSPHPKRRRLDSEGATNGHSTARYEPHRDAAHKEPAHKDVPETTHKEHRRSSDVNAARESEGEAGQEAGRAWEEAGSQPLPPEPSKEQYKDTTEDSMLIKEEVVEENHTSGGGYPSEDMGDSTEDGGHHDPPSASSEYPQPPMPIPHEADAMAGPSGIQEWLGSGDLSCKVEMYPGMDDSVPNPTLPHSLGEVGGGCVAEGMARPVMTPYQHKCKHCPYTTLWHNELKAHVSQAHGSSKPFACTRCPMRFAQKYSLQVHMRKHTGEKPFACAHCPFRCTQKGNLQKHEKTHRREMERQ